MKYLAICLFLLTIPLPALARCPADKKDWARLAPKFLIQEAARQPNLGISDFSENLKKKDGPKSSIYAFGKKTYLVGAMQVQVEDAPAQLFLSGVVKCDVATKELKLVNLTWVKDGKSGLINLMATE